MIDVEEFFEANNGEYLKGQNIPEAHRLHSRPDLCAFLLLDKLVPGSGDMVCDAEHDEIFLDTDVSALAKVASEEDLLTLIRCGVRFNEELYSLCMFV